MRAHPHCKDTANGRHSQDVAQIFFAVCRQVLLWRLLLSWDGALASALAQSESGIFGGFHDFAFARAFVVDAYEVKHTVNEHAVEFVIVVFS